MYIQFTIAALLLGSFYGCRGDDAIKVTNYTEHSAHIRAVYQGHDFIMETNSCLASQSAAKPGDSLYLVRTLGGNNIAHLVQIIVTVKDEELSIDPTKREGISGGSWSLILKRGREGISCIDIKPRCQTFEASSGPESD